MSLNHFPSDFSQTHWWPQPQQHEMMMMMEPLNSKTTTTSSSSPSSFWPNSHHQFFSSTGHPISCSSISGLRFDLNNEEDEETQLTTEENAMKDHAVVLEEEEVDIGHEIIIPKEPLFEKPLTPSDVGKLNRLVIPKQHAEKYFPLNGVSESGEKGLLLSFEDELGKPWRFRYSYWNSSQSYVLTKGWSRFVKEKKLDAGDIVQFERHRHDCDRMFIGWRRRKNVGGGSVHQAATAAAGLAVVSSSTGGNGRWQPYPPQTTFHGPAALSLPYPPPASVHAAAAGGGESRTITAASGNCKRLRLFGVNMECQPDDDSVSSNQFPGPGPGPGPANYHYYPKLLHANYHHPNHMEVDYPGDISQSRYQQG